MRVRRAEDAWNGRDPGRIALAYTPESRWRIRDDFLAGRPIGHPGLSGPGLSASTRP
jgi:nuclear transport factor 2 (NTF2) superfamily protein